jgi:hypothetical protein
MRVLPGSDPNLIYLYSEYKKTERQSSIGQDSENVFRFCRFSYYYNTITDGIDKYSTLVHSNGVVDPKDLDCYSGSVNIDIIEFIDTYMKRGSSKTGISGYDFNHLLDLRKTILRNRNLNDIMDGYY